MIELKGLRPDSEYKNGADVRLSVPELDIICTGLEFLLGEFEYAERSDTVTDYDDHNKNKEALVKMKALFSELYKARTEVLAS